MTTVCCWYIRMLLNCIWNTVLLNSLAILSFSVMRGDIFPLSNRWDVVNKACLLQYNLVRSSWMHHGSKDWFNDVYLIKSQLRRQINLFNSLQIVNMGLPSLHASVIIAQSFSSKILTKSTENLHKWHPITCPWGWASLAHEAMHHWPMKASYEVYFVTFKFWHMFRFSHCSFVDYCIPLKKSWQCFVDYISNCIFQ